MTEQIYLTPESNEPIEIIELIIVSLILFVRSCAREIVRSFSPLPLA